MPFRSVQVRPIHHGHVFDVVIETFESPDGERFDRDLVRHPGAVAVVALNERDEVVLVRQFRPALGRWLVEIPAGLLDVAGESLVAAAQRELIEETGYEATMWSTITSFLPAVGFTDERITLFLARGLNQIGSRAQGVEERQMEVLHVDLAELVRRIGRGEIEDSKTIVGVLLVHHARHE